MVSPIIPAEIRSPELADGIDGNIVGTVDSPVDPLFVQDPNPGPDEEWGTEDDDYGDLRLRPNSPAVDAGDNALLPADTADLDDDADTQEPLPLDYGGYARVVNGIVDMGAHEFGTDFIHWRIYVDQHATGSGDGTSWTDAFTRLDAALAFAANLLESQTKADSGHLPDTVHEIWIADGVYTPVAERHPGDPRSATFELVDGVTLFGGFAATEDAIGERNPDPTVNETILSGDIGIGGDVGDNAYSVVVCPAEVTAGVDGVTITGGYAVDPATMIYRENTFGGGLYNEGDLTVSNTRIVGNAAQYGGAAHNHLGSLEFTNVAVVGNSAAQNGGAVCNSGMLTLTGATITGNQAASSGGAIYSYGSGSDAVLQNTILAGNAADVCPTACIASGALTGRNNLLDDGSDQAALIDGVDGNRVGTDTSPIDPRFVRDPSHGGDGWGDDPDTPDVDESANDDYGDLRLQSDSPAVDAGDASALPVDLHDFDGDADRTEPLPFDVAGNPRIANTAVDIGAYEFTPVDALPGDLNNDGTVNSDDLNIVRSFWGQSVPAGNLLQGDPTGDGIVNSDDLDIVRANWGAVAAAASGGRIASQKRQVVARDAVFADYHAAAEAAWREAVAALETKTNRVSSRAGANQSALLAWDS